MPFLVFLFVAAFTAVEGWAVMLVIGALHSEAPGVPAFSYFASLWLVVLVNILVSPVVARNNA